MDAISLLLTRFDALGEEPGWPDDGWPTLADARAAAADDAAVAALLHRHREDPRAGLVVVAALLPAVAARARRLGLEPAACVSSLWLVVEDRSRGQISDHPRAGLVLEATRRAAREERAADLPVAVADGARPWPDVPAPHPRAEAVLTRAAGLGLLSRRQLRDLRAVYLDEVPVSAYARARDESVASARRRLRRGITALAAHREALRLAS